MDGLNTRWLRLTTVDAPGGFPNPAIDFSAGNTLSFWLNASIGTPANFWIGTNGSNWSDTASWQTGTVPNATNATANLLTRTEPTTVNLDIDVTLNTLRLNSAAPNGYTISGPSALTFDGGLGFVGTINSEVGSHTIAVPVRFNKTSNIAVGGASDVLTMSGAVSFTNAASMTLTKTGAGRVDLPALVNTQDPVNNAVGLVVSGGTMRLTAGAGISKVNSILISGGATLTGKLDITNNPVNVDYTGGTSPLDSIKASIRSAYNSGAWDANGVTSSQADSSNRAIGYAEASTLSSIPAVFGTVDADAVLLILTRYGDSNLDGSVTLADFNALANNFGSQDADWVQGDFDYDSQVGLADFNRLAGNFGLSASAGGPTPEDWSNLLSAVPEPGARRALVRPAAADAAPPSGVMPSTAHERIHCDGHLHRHDRACRRMCVARARHHRATGVATRAHHVGGRTIR